MNASSMHMRVMLLASVLFFATASAGAAELTFDLRVERGRLPDAMRLVCVKQGDIVKLRWSTDRPIVLHLHGYNIETKVEPGSVAEMTFTARATGRFPIELHLPNKGSSGHSHGEAPLVRIEVHPK
jgi:hypothetical protein